MPLFVRHTRRRCKIRDEVRTALARAVVVARHGADDLVERGDDGDDAGRCRSDARARTRAALAKSFEDYLQDPSAGGFRLTNTSKILPPEASGFLRKK